MRKPQECNTINTEQNDIESTTYPEIEQILKKFEDCFAKDNSELGRITIEKHRIPLSDDKPISQRPYRCSAADEAEINRQVKDLLSQGLIRESNSPYSSPVTLVSKKDGGKRLCIDFRLLNSKTINDVQPMPVIQDVIDKLNGAKIFSKLDIFWGF